MTLLSERSNIVFINDTNTIEYHFNGYRREQLILKGDSAVNVFNRTRALPKIVPTKDTFELSIYTVETDSLLFTERFIAINRNSLRETENNTLQDFEYCDYIFSYDNENTLFRSKENKLYLRRNNYIDSLVTFEIENGLIISSAPDNIIITPGEQKQSTVKVFYDGELVLTKQYRVGD